MDPTNANTALASAFVEELERSGVRLAVVSPGSRSTPLAVALWRASGIEVEVIVDERSASFFALGAAQACGAPVAILCTSGTAAANYHPAICEADESAVPLIALTADRPPELRGIGAGQTIDQIKLYGSAVRWFCEVGTHDADEEGLLHLRSVACRAVAAARGRRPGPVHLNLPWREPLAPVAVEGSVRATDPLALEGRAGAPLVASPTPVSTHSTAEVDRVAELVEGSGSGLIVAGRQTDPALREPLSRLAAATGFPILAEPTSQLRCGPHDRSRVVASYDLLLREEGFAARRRPDLVLRFGEMPTSKPLRRWLADSGAEQIVVDPLGGWNEPSRRAGTILRTEPAALARALADKAPPAAGLDDGEAWLEAERAARAAVDAALESVGGASEPGLHRALGAAHGDGDLVYTASSMPIRDQEAFLPAARTDALFLCNRGANGIDGLVSSGIGAGAASGRPTTIVTGDLGLLHDIGGLAAARAEGRPPLRIVVIDNDGGGIFHFLPQAAVLGDDEFEALLGTPRGVDAARAAALFGLPHRRLESLEALPEALAAGSGLVEVDVDRGRNVAVHRTIETAVREAVAGI
jgi:2-succinyl-5-enolpyruvyl-6-hydroxy-3-cyclohexene-1-carboxylate synthase